jgi:pimeloyl-ACP methyl ester carboxylesterase
VPTTVVLGGADKTAKPEWHLDWLVRHLSVEHVISLPGVGHAVHHAEPNVILDLIRSSVAAIEAEGR